LGRGFGHDKEGKRGREDAARALASWASGARWARPKAGNRGRKGTGRARGKEGRAVGCRLRAELGRKMKREKKILFFFISQHFKAFSIEILKFYLSFQIEHTIQNIMQQHQCSIMFLPLYLILN
jgi:hypothetical protein